jgi:hypothetical protein
MQTELQPTARAGSTIAPRDTASDEFGHFRDAATAGNVVFYHSGYFSQAVIDAGVASIRARLDTAGTDNKSRRRLLSSFIEIAQNVVHYSADAATDPQADNNEARFGTVCIAARGDRFHIRCANPVRATERDRLARKLSLLRDMDMDDIRRAYREILRTSQSDEGSKGAGLGLLTMARDACEPIEYDFAEDAMRGSACIIFRMQVII